MQTKSFKFLIVVGAILRSLQKRITGGERKGLSMYSDYRQTMRKSHLS